MTRRYVAPSWFTTHVWNRLVLLAMALGVSFYGARSLAVRGRSSGAWRTTPVNVLTVGADRYLVAPRGVTQWVRTLRVTGEAELRLGARREAIRITELADGEKPPVLRAYLRQWAFEVGAFFQGVGPESPDDKLLQIAPGHPVFRIQR
ncbi:MAG: nitroreductase/quinone reductase family protein [Chloroflexota bacterium]